MTEPLPSPLASALTRVGDRWTMLIIGKLLEGPRRFNDLLESLPGLAPNILSQRLKHLEREFLVVTEAYSERPPRFAYRLSEQGMDLAGALRLLADWGARHAGSQPQRHEMCGTELESRWYCPACGEIVEESDTEPEVRII